MGIVASQAELQDSEQSPYQAIFLFFCHQIQKNELSNFNQLDRWPSFLSDVFFPEDSGAPCFFFLLGPFAEP
jgi:hypothetical protein